MGEIGLGWRIGNSHHGSNGSDIGNRRWSSINSIYIVGIVWPPTGVPEMPIMAAKVMRPWTLPVKVMRPWAIPAIGMPMGAVIWPIWICLGK